jgi:hypothetical protein
VSKSHLVIAGTGRAGTSFLVRFLDACGLETAAEGADWNARARAGGESVLDPDADLPYVVKDPWLWTYCRSLDLDRLKIDSLLVPMRDLMDAAASRVLQERVALAETPWVDRAVAGGAAGGVVYSLSIADQARILAVGFHELLHWAVSNDIPTVLLDFPRIVEDRDYLVSSLWPFLDGRLNRDATLAAFDRVADSDAVRVGSQAGEVAASGPDAEAGLDRAALAIRIGELRAEADELRAEADDTRERRSAVEAELDRGKDYAESLEAELRRMHDTLRRMQETRLWRLGARWLSLKARLHRKRTPVG